VRGGGACNSLVGRRHMKILPSPVCWSIRHGGSPVQWRQPWRAGSAVEVSAARDAAVQASSTVKAEWGRGWHGGGRVWKAGDAVEEERSREIF
jgi:hypothetical protein